MPRIPVASIADPRLTVYRDLIQSSPATRSELFVVEGRTLVRRLLDSSFETMSVLVAEQFADEFADRLDSQTPLYVTTAAGVDQIVGFDFHRGVLACGRRKPANSLAEVIANDAPAATVVICSQVVDPTNLGGIIRNSAAFGVNAMILGPGCADPFSRRVLRVSMGTALRLPIVESTHLLADVAFMRKSLGFEIVATVLDESAESLEKSHRSPRLALAFGNEGPGLSDDWLEASDRCVTIPMKLGVDSLNVATASGVFLYHFCRAAKTRDGLGVPDHTWGFSPPNPQRR